MTDPREPYLPKWAQQIINDLRQRLDISRDPLLTEVVKLRPLVAKERARADALQYLLTCAAKGGHMTAQEIVNVIEEFELVLRPKEE